MIAAYRRAQLLANALRKDQTPRHQAETHAIIQHGKAAACRDHHLPIDARSALAVNVGDPQVSNVGRTSLSTATLAATTEEPRASREPRRKPTEDDLLLAANELADASKDPIPRLRLFHRNKYPLDPAPLLAFARS